MRRRVAGLALAGAVVVAGCGESEADRDARIMFAHQERVKAQLRDPGSAQFRAVRLYKTMDPPVVCGEVNAKNGFGAYMGFTRFVSRGSLQVIESELGREVSEPDAMDEVWRQFCR